MRSVMWDATFPLIDVMWTTSLGSSSSSLWRLAAIVRKEFLVPPHRVCKALLLAVACFHPGAWATDVGHTNEVPGATSAPIENPAALAAYQHQVSELVRQQIVFESNPEQDNLEAELLVLLLPGREVVDVQIRKSSGSPLYDQAVMRAMAKLGRLPSPPEGIDLGRAVIFRFRLR